MLHKVDIKGELYSGLGKGSFFTQIDWVKKGILNICGFEPFPGTVNLRISPEDYEFIVAIKEGGAPLTPPDPNFCTAKVLKANIEGIECAIVFPEESVWAHEDTLEIMAPLSLRKTLGVKDKDILTVNIERKLDLKAIIFDLDGTLIDSMSVFYKVGEIIAQKLGLPRLDREDMRKIMNHGKDPWEALIPEDMLNRQRLMEIGLSLDRAIFKESYLKDARVFPWVGGLLLGLLKHGLKLAILTTGWELELPQRLFKDVKIDFYETFSVIHSCSKTAEKQLALKQGVLEISKALSLKPWDCAYVGDSVINIQAGKSVKAFTIGVLTGIATKEEMLDAGADLVLDAASALLQILKEP